MMLCEVLTLRTRGSDWAANAVTVNLARELLAPPATEGPDTADSAGGEAAATTGETTGELPNATPAASPAETGGPPEPASTDDNVVMSSSPLWASSSLYRGWMASHRFLKTSWLYRWLTAEPDPEVIVIDLRDTLSVAPLLSSLDRLIRDSIAIVPTSGWARLAYRLRTRFFEQPIRILSGG